MTEQILKTLSKKRAEKKNTDILFQTDDKLGRADFAERLIQVIEADYTFAEGSYVLGLNAAFGTGKTHFLKMWEHYLREEKKYQVIYIDAWEDDFADEPIIPIVSAFLNHFEKNKKNQEIINGVKETLGKILYAGNEIVKFKYGVDVAAICGGDMQTQLAKLGGEYYDSFKVKKEAILELKNLLHDYVETLEEKPFFILVDELDRARPNYSIKFLETIKHIFSVQSIVFVLAINKEQLESSAKALYGTQLKFEDYYNRFVYTTVPLPSPQSYLEFIRTLYEKHIKNIPASNSVYDIKNKMIVFFNYLAINFKLTLRNIEHIFRMFSYYARVSQSQTVNQYDVAALGFLIALFFHDKDLYHKIGRGKITIEEFRENFFDGALLQGNYDFNKFEFFYLIFYMENIENSRELIEVLKHDNNSYTDEFEKTIDRDRLVIIQGRLGKNSRFFYLYKTIEQWNMLVEIDKNTQNPMN